MLIKTAVFLKLSVKMKLYICQDLLLLSMKEPGMSDLNSFIKTFYSYLKYEKRYSNDTLKNYSLDLNKFFTYLSSKKVVKVT